MIRFDLISTRPLRPSLPKSERSLFTYSTDFNSPFAEIENLINKGITPEQLFGSFICKAAAEPTMVGKIGRAKPDLPPTPASTSVGFGATQRVSRSPSVAHAQTMLAPQVAGATGLSGTPTKTQWEPGHVKAAHDALAAHHLHEHYRVLSNKGPEAAQQAGHMQQHLQHSIASEKLAKQGVEATPQHHKDLMEFHSSGTSEAGGTPVQTNVSPMHQWAAHQSMTSMGGHGVRGVVSPAVPSDPTRVGTGPRAAMMGLKPAPLLRPGSKEEAPDFTTVASPKARTTAEKPTKIERSILAINDLLKSAADLKKDFGYGGAAESAGIGQAQPAQLPSLNPEHRQEQQLTKKRKKQKQNDRFLSVGKSLQLLNDMLSLA